MAALTGVESGTVTWEVYAASQDTNDEDREPNFGNFRGAVVFTPSRKSVRRLYPTPITIFLDEVTGQVGDDGILRDLSGEVGVVLVSPFATGIEEKGTWNWEAAFQLNQREKVAFPIDFQPGETVDLTRATPVITTPGIVITKGDKGDKGDAATVAVGAVTTGAPGSVADVDNVGTPAAAVFDFTIPKGDKGDPGAPGAPDATPTVKGSIRLAGDISGTADSPTVPGLASKMPTPFPDPGADRIVFWDDSAGVWAALTASTGLTLTGTTLIVRSATEALTGIVELATTAEAAAATDTTRAVTSAGLAAFLAGANATETIQDRIGADIVAGANVTVIFDDATGKTTIASEAGGSSPTYANLPAGSTITVQKSGATWPVRPTSRTDITVAWKGADPSPAIGGTGMMDGVDYRLVTP